MRVIERHPVTSSVLVSSTVPETDYPSWNGGVTYAAGDRVIYAHRIVESAVDGNTGHNPAGGTGEWVDVGPTNRWAMFDDAGGPVTTLTTTITVQLALDNEVAALGMVDLLAASVRVVVVSGGVTLSDQTRNPAVTAEVFNIPSGASRTATITVIPTGGMAKVGKLVLGAVLEIGDTEAGPSIGITDFSKRTTDDFGITTIVERSYAKRLSTRCRIDSDAVDAIQRRLASLRATPALWIADDANPGLILYGYYKDFSIDLTIGSTSFCSLSIDGLPSADIQVAASDPAIAAPSNFVALRPETVTDAVLSASNAPETDYPAWSSLTTYTAGARAISTATHRIYESIFDNNIGNDPTADMTNWVDVGPTNRWAMFDQALGTATQRAGSLSVTLIAPSQVNALAMLDLAPGTVRVQAGSYDQTKTIEASGSNAATFLDLSVPAGGTIIITVTAAQVSVGTLLIGTMEPFGSTETAPTIGITDFSKRTTDDFGNTSAVERAWAKKMSLKSLIAPDSVDGVIRRLSSLRAVPTLWIGDDGFDSLTLYGFYRDFSIEVGPSTAICALTVEGLSKAAKAAAVDAATVNISLTSDRRAITYNGAGAIAPEAQAVNFTARLQNTNGPIRWAVMDTAGNTRSAQAYLSAGDRPYTDNGDGTFTAFFGDVQMSAAQFDAARDGTEGVIVTATIDGTTATATADVLKVQDGTNAINNVNLVRDAGFGRGLTGWGYAVNNGTINSGYPEFSSASVYQRMRVQGTFTAGEDRFISIFSAAPYISVTPHQRYAVQALVEATGPISGGSFYVSWLDASGAFITPSPNVQGFTGEVAYPASFRGFLTAPDGAVRGIIGWRANLSGAGVATISLAAPMVTTATPDQTDFPAFALGPETGQDGTDGTDGSDGIDALSVSIAPSSIPVPCTAGGTPKASLPGAQFKVFKGTADVTNSTTYSIGSVSNLSGVSVSGSGAVSVTGITGGTSVLTGYVDVTATKDGASQSVRLVYNKALDGAAFVDGTASVAAPSGTSYETVASLNLLMGPNGTVEFDTSGGFSHGTGGTLNVEGTIDYSLNGSSWTTALSFTGNPATSGEAGDWGVAVAGSISGASIGLSTKQTAYFRVQMRKTSSGAFSDFGGSFYTSWRG